MVKFEIFSFLVKIFYFETDETKTKGATELLVTVLGGDHGRVWSLLEAL